MTEDQFFEKEIEQIIQLVQEAETDNFFEIAKILGQDPKKDLAGANLHKCDLSSGDLQGAYLRKTDLSNANLSGADLRGADLRGADLTYADLTNTRLEEVEVDDALFGNNKGLSLENKNYLRKSGAIFTEVQSNIKFPSPTILGNLIYQYEPSFWGFLKYTFAGKIDQINPEFINLPQERIPRIARLRRIARNQINDKENNLSIPIVITFSWLLSVIFLVAFVVITYQAVILNSERANNVIYNAFTLILGCFIGALTTYLRIASEQKDR